MQTAIKQLTVRSIVRQGETYKYLANLRIGRSLTTAVHKEFDAFTVRWLNTAEPDERRQWERVGYNGVPFFCLPDKKVAVEIAESLVRLVDDGASLPAAAAVVARGWEALMVEPWEQWSRGTRELFVKKYGSGT